MQLVVHGVEPQLFPYVDDEVEGVASMAGVKDVAEAEPVLLEDEQMYLACLEAGIELVEVAGEAALVQMAPHWGHRVDELYVVVTVADNAIQIFVDREDAYGL